MPPGGPHHGNPLRIGWFTTRGASSRQMFEAVVEAIDGGTLDAEVAYVFSNRERGVEDVTDSFFDLVESRGLPLLTLDSVAFRKAHGGERSRPGAPLPAWRLAYDAEVARQVDRHPADLVVLAGYMLIFTAPFVVKHPAINLHPALPDGPVGTWREVIRALIRSGASESGAMVHLAIPEVDAGPVAAFCRYPIRGGEFDAARAALPGGLERLDDEAIEDTELFARIRAAMVEHEGPLLVSTLQAFADGRLTLRDGDIHGTDVPLDLTGDVRARLSGMAERDDSR